MHFGYKELFLLRTFSCGHLGLLYPESTVRTYVRTAQTENFIRPFSKLTVKNERRYVRTNTNRSNCLSVSFKIQRNKSVAYVRTYQCSAIPDLFFKTFKICRIVMMASEDMLSNTEYEQSIIASY